MIIVDTNIIAYLYLPTDFTPFVEELVAKEPIWGAPYLWRSEFRNVLALYIRKELISFGQAIQIQNEAEILMAENEFKVSSIDILTLVNESSCSAYDCEFVALAQDLKTSLITTDKKILSEFPSIAKSLQLFLKES
ncbi:type II toxin-antitoxin system VapC family toxin [Desulfosarcina variabilis]|uniref:type II toxin-antitoxin system VapC family toxin n=1 Tax=Desulfosarcina variabilis TaxID=2300 RepID=UPI003AFB6660